MSNVLTDDQRLDRVGEILALGIGRLLLSESRSDDLETAIQSKKRFGNDRLELPRENEDILKFISKIRVASPAEIRSKFNISRTTAYRRLRDLERRGLIRRSGSSRSVVYEVAA